MTALAVAVALPGLAIGSFLNVVAARVPLRQSIVHPPSACMGCGHEIARVDNIPVVSWLLLRGRCRHCDARISIRYPAIELVTAAVVVGCFLAFGATAYGILAAGFCIVLVTLAAIDVEYGIVPNAIVLPAAGVCLAVQTVLEPSFLWVVAAFAAAGFLRAIALAYPSGIEMREVKLAFLLGAMLGGAVTAALAIGFLFIVMAVAMLTVPSRSKARRIAVPSVPFLAFGAVVVLFAVDPVNGWSFGPFG